MAIGALGDDLAAWGGVFAWVFVSGLDLVDPAGEPLNSIPHSRDWLDEWLLDRILNDALRAFGVDDTGVWRTVSAIRLMLAYPQVFTTPEDAEHERADHLLDAMLGDVEIQRFLGINRYNNTVWFDQTGFDLLLHWLLIVGAITRPDESAFEARYRTLETLRSAAAQSGFEVEKLRAAVAPRADPVKKPIADPLKTAKQKPDGGQ